MVMVQRDPRASENSGLWQTQCLRAWLMSASADGAMCLTKKKTKYYYWPSDAMFTNVVLPGRQAFDQNVPNSPIQPLAPILPNYIT